MKWVIGALAGTLAVSPAWAQAPAAAGETAVYFGGFGGTLQRAMQNNVMRPFEKKTGIHVTYITATSNELLAKARAQGDHPQIDVIWATETTHFQGDKLGTFVKLDPAIVTELPKLYPFARPTDQVGVVMGEQALALEYNTKVFQQHHWQPPTSWWDLWDPRFKGHVVSYNLPIGYATGFVGLINVLAGGSSQDMSPAWTKVKTLLPSVMSFVDPPAQVDALFANGSAWISYNGSGRITDLAATGVPVAMAIPKEGALANPDFFDLVRNAPHSKAAQVFINYVLSPEVQEIVARTMSLAPVNPQTNLDPVTAKKLDFGPKGVAGLRHIDMDTINGNIDKLTQQWSDLVAHK